MIIFMIFVLAVVGGRAATAVSFFIVVFIVLVLGGHPVYYNI